MYEPPERGNRQHADQDYTVVVHRRYRGRQRIRETIHDVEENDERDGDSVDDKASFAHPKGARWNITPAREYVGKETHCIRRGAEDDKRSSEITERGLATERDGAECVGQKSRE